MLLQKVLEMPWIQPTWCKSAATQYPKSIELAKGVTAREHTQCGEVTVQSCDPIFILEILCI